MATDSLFEDMEPRHMHLSKGEPHVPFMLEGIHQAQVSEPSLFGNENFHPRVGVYQASPLKSPNFIPKLTPLPCVPKSSRLHSQNKQLCECLKPTFSENQSSSSKDTELKKLIEDQNTQLKVLQQQVKQLLQYQERLQDKTEDKNMTHESTQTSFLDNQLLQTNNSPISRIPAKLNHKSIPICQPQEHMTEFTLTFRDLQLETILEQPPSPQQSFTVAMQEYQESISENSDNSTESLNVMDHVQNLLAQANIASNKKFFSDKFKDRIQHATANFVENPVRKVTMQRVQELGVSFIAPNAVLTNNVTQKNSTGLIWDLRKETDQSVEMERLAEKYLGHSSTKQISWQPQSNNGSRSSGRLEMSISSQQYLERYGLSNQNY